MRCADPDGSVTCSLDTPGLMSVSFNFGNTQGRFYLRSRQDPTKQYAFACTNNGTLLDLGVSGNPQFVAQVPAQTISCPITVVDSSNANPPTTPTVTGGACTVGTAFTLSFTSTDPTAASSSTAETGTPTAPSTSTYCPRAM